MNTFNSGVFFTNTQKLMICMILLLFSIIIHYFLNNNYYNISTNVEKCPFCYGNNLCATFDNNEITFTNLTHSEKLSNIINIKNVYIANYRGSKVVLKKLGHNWELAEIDNRICKDQIYEDFCPPYPESFHKDFSTNIIEFLMNNDKDTPLNLKLCSSTTLNYFIDSLFSLYTHVNTSVMTANLWTTILANVEPLMLQLLSADDGWPVPKYYGACGRIIIQEYCGRSLYSIENDPWILRAKLALQLLKAADDFTNKHSIFRFYLTDISSDNIVVTDDYKIKFIDLENVIITEKISQFEDFSPHESQNFDCYNCYAFSPEEICAHRISDHNFYSVCKLLLSNTAPWPMMQNGLLHSPPEHILRNHPEIFDYLENCAESNGVVVIDEDYKNRKIFGQVVCSFRYGREEDEVMGLTFQKDLYLASEQIYPPPEKQNTTKLQDRLIKKLGSNALPFTFILPPSAPASVTLQPGKEDEGEPCGVMYYVKVFAGDSETDRTHKRSTVTLGIRKVQYAPSKQGRQPCTVVRKDFMLSPGELELECTLDKQLYHHGEKVAVNICIRNNSNKVVKKIKTMVQQGVDVVLFQNGQYRSAVASIETQEGCPIQPGSTLQKVMYLTPLLESNKERRGIALDGQLKKQDTNLASTTLLSSPDQRDAFGIIVSYAVKVKLYLGALGGEISAELPFVLMHPKPGVRPKVVHADSQADVEMFRQDTIDQDPEIEAY